MQEIGLPNPEGVTRAIEAAPLRIFHPHRPCTSPLPVHRSHSRPESPHASDRRTEGHRTLPSSDFLRSAWACVITGKLFFEREKVSGAAGGQETGAGGRPCPAERAQVTGSSSQQNGRGGGGSGWGVPQEYCSFIKDSLHTQRLTFWDVSAEPDRKC